MYTYVRQTKLSNICGRSDYITNATGKHKQEDVLLIGGPISDWKPYADYEKSHQMSDEPNNQGRELTVALPNSWANLVNRPLLRSRVAALTEKLIGKDTDYQFAVHWNTKKTNLHVHIIFSERRAVSEPHSGNVWDRDIYLTSEGKVARRKADRAVDAQGNILPPVHRKGDLKENQTFSAKDKVYKSKKWLNDAKQIVSKAWANPLIPDKKHNQNFLHTYHEGKSPLAAQSSRARNEIIRNINQTISDLMKAGYKFPKKSEFLKLLYSVCYIDKKLVPVDRETIAGFATNYDKITARSEKQAAEAASKAAEQEKYDKSVAVYLVEHMIDEKVAECVNVDQIGGNYNKDFREALQRIKTPHNKTYDKIIRKGHMSLDSAGKTLGSTELRDVIRKKLELYKTADDCVYSPGYLKISKKNAEYQSRPYAKQLDDVISYFNAYCQENIVQTHKSVADRIEMEKEAEKERIERMQREYEAKTVNRAAKEPGYAPPPHVPDPEHKKKDTWSR